MLGKSSWPELPPLLLLLTIGYVCYKGKQSDTYLLHNRPSLYINSAVTHL